MMRKKTTKIDSFHCSTFEQCKSSFVTWMSFYMLISGVIGAASLSAYGVGKWSSSIDTRITALEKTDGEINKKLLEKLCVIDSVLQKLDNLQSIRVIKR